MNGIIEIIAGIGIFLLGINQIECSLRDLGSASLTNTIERFANTPFRGILIGLFATAILQSSSVVGLITLAFVGAGILSLRLAITIILGANLGTTATGWIVALIGFKLDLSHYYLLLIGLGAFGRESLFSVETATERERAVRLAHDHFSQTIYQQLDNREISDEEASTAFNMNREFLISGHSLSNALQNFWLTFPEVQTLSDIINNKRI